jgi:DNA-binding CsgD family transcriptional regulator
MPDAMSSTEHAHPGEVRILLDAGTARALLGALSTAVAPPGVAARRGEPLTPREREVLAGLSQGKSYGQIGAELFIELETVRTHARRVRRKLGVASSRELLGWAAAEGTPPASGHITP